MNTSDPRAHAEELRNSGSAYVLATVVRAERPTSAKPGAHAVVHADGMMLGFVGGDCAQASVRAQALAALTTGEPVLLRGLATDMKEAYRIESEISGEVFSSEDATEGPLAFAEKRAPKWQNR